MAWMPSASAAEAFDLVILDIGIFAAGMVRGYQPPDAVPPLKIPSSLTEGAFRLTLRSI